MGRHPCCWDVWTLIGLVPAIFSYPSTILLTLVPQSERRRDDEEAQRRKTSPWGSRTWPTRSIISRFNRRSAILLAPWPKHVISRAVLMSCRQQPVKYVVFPRDNLDPRPLTIGTHAWAARFVRRSRTSSKLSIEDTWPCFETIESKKWT